MEIQEICPAFIQVGVFFCKTFIVSQTFYLTGQKIRIKNWPIYKSASWKIPTWIFQIRLVELEVLHVPDLSVVSLNILPATSFSSH